MQWFLSESGWVPQEVNGRRLELLPEGSTTASSEKSVLVIDERGDRKVGQEDRPRRQVVVSLSIDETENGLMSVSSLLAGERVYYPVEAEPYIPAHHFEGGKNDSEFRTTLTSRWARGRLPTDEPTEQPEGNLPADSLGGERGGL